MRAGVGAHPQAMRHKQLGDHLARGALTIGARHMDGAIRIVRVAHQIDQTLNVGCARRFDSASLFIHRMGIEICSSALDCRIGHDVNGSAFKKQRAWVCSPLANVW